MRLNLRYGLKAAYFTPESAPMEQHAAIMLEKYCGRKINTLNRMAYEQAKDYYRSRIYYIFPPEGYFLDEIFKCAEVLVRRNGIKVLVIDPYNYIESQQGNKTETQYISEILTKLKTVADKLDLLVFLVAHPTKVQVSKGEKVPVTLNSIAGSANFRNKADFGIVVERNYVENFTTIKVQKVKFRHLGHNGDSNFRFNINNGRYQPMTEEIAITWDNRNYISEGFNNIQSEPIFTEETFKPSITQNDFLQDGGDCPF